jgi:hypothetical protein
LRTKSRPEFLAGPKLSFHRSLLFSLPTRSDEDKILIQFFDARSASSYQVILFFGFLFEHQFNNLIEFSENNFCEVIFFGNLWKHEDHFWNVSLDKKIIKICVAYPIYFLNPCENFHHQIKIYFGRSSFFGRQQLTAFKIFFRFSVKNFSLGIPKSNLKIKMTLTKNLYEIWLLVDQLLDTRLDTSKTIQKNSCKGNDCNGTLLKQTQFSLFLHSLLLFY